MQWDDPQDQHATVTVPHVLVCVIGADGVYADDCSALGGASSSKTSTSKRKRTSPHPTEVEWALNEVTKIKVTPVTGVYEDTPITTRTMVTFIYNIESHGELVRQPP